MPSVPTYDNATVAPEALPGVRQTSIASPELFAGSDADTAKLGASVESFGGQLAAIQSDIQRRENADQVFRAETQVKTDYIKYQTDAVSRVGANAKGLATDTADWWDKALADNSAKLQNDTQKQVFRNQITASRLQSIDAMSIHEAQQNRISLGQSASASIMADTNTAASAVGTPLQDQAIASAKTNIIDKLTVMRQLNGWTQDQYNVAENEKLTNLHMQVIQNINRSDPDAAQAYFTANKKEINGGQYDTIDKMIEAGNTLIGAQKVADQIDYQKVSEMDALDFVRANSKGKQRDHALTLVRQQYADIEHASLVQKRTADDDGVKVWVATGDLSQIPPDTWSAMSGATQDSLQKEAALAAKREKVETNWPLYYELRQKYQNADPTDPKDKFYDPAVTNMNNYRSGLADAQYKEMVDLQTQRQKPPKEETLNRQLSTTFRTLGWTPANNAQQMGQFESVARQAIKDEETAQGGKPLNDDARQKVIDRLAIDGKIQGSSWFRDTRGKGYEFYGTDDAKNFTAIPGDVDYKKAKEALQRKGVSNPSDDQITATVNRAYGIKKSAPAPVGSGTVLAPAGGYANVPSGRADQMPNEYAPVQPMQRSGYSNTDPNSPTRVQTRDQILQREQQDNPEDSAAIQKVRDNTQQQNHLQTMEDAAYARYTTATKIFSDADSVSNETHDALRADVEAAHKEYLKAKRATEKFLKQ